MEQRIARRAARQGPKKLHDKKIQLKLPSVLFSLLRKEAKKDQRTMSALIRKLCTEALAARGVFTKGAIQ